MRSEARGEAVRSEEEEVGRGACVVGPRCPVRCRQFALQTLLVR